jgi:pyrroloquinoline quinone biosynthesis protein B
LDARSCPLAGILLTDAEIDHTAGLLLLHESSTATRVYRTDAVRRALTDGPVLTILAHRDHIATAGSMCIT